MERDQPPIDLELLTTDAELLLDALEGTAEQREEAIKKLQLRYWRVAQNSAFVILRNDESARDVAQETMVKMWLRLRTINPVSIRAWIATIARNAAYTIRQRMHRFVQLGCDGQTPVEQRPDNETPFNHALYEEIMRAIDRLPAKQRVVVERHLLEGHAVIDIAADLHITTAAVYARLEEAKKKLRSLFRPISADPENDE